MKKEKRSSESGSSSSSSDSNDSSSSSDSDSDDNANKIPAKIKKEKDAESSSISKTIDLPQSKAIKIKTEPASDVEGKTFKKPFATNSRLSLNSSQTSIASQKATTKRKRNTSISDQLDSILSETVHQNNANPSAKKKAKLTPTKDKRKSIRLMDSLTDQTLGNLSTAFQSPSMSSTLKPNARIGKGKTLDSSLANNKKVTKSTEKSPVKVKKEIPSEDESSKKSKKKSAAKDKTKSLNESDLLSNLFSSYLK